MGGSFFGTSVQGASHARTEKPCQDSNAIRNYKFKYPQKKRKVNTYYEQLTEDIAILSVADGHGSDSCPYSQTGSQIAVNVFCDIMAEFCMKYHDDMERLFIYLNREADTKIAKSIDMSWKERVLNHHKLQKRAIPTNCSGETDNGMVYQQYGTTLLGMVLTSKFIFVFQLGDGNILYVDKKSVRPVLETEKILGVETHSLSKKDAWKNAVTCVVNIVIEPEKPYMYVLTTDGMANSFISEVEYHKSCREYFETIVEHGVENVKENLKGWLIETSTLGCGDDISAVFAYFE